MNYFKANIVIGLLIFGIAFGHTNANAQQGRIALIRDAEIEALVNDYAAPLFKAAGLRRGAVSIHIVNDNSFNAFVSGRGMFLNTGLLLQSETPQEVIGVIAHEIGHIVGGHQIRMRERLDNAARIARLYNLLGVGIGVAGSLAGNSSVARSGLGVAGGGSNILLRSVLEYQRGEEAAADRTGVTLLRKTKQSGRGMLETFKRLGKQQSIIAGKIDPYLQSHPLPNERITLLTSLITKSKYYNTPGSAALQRRHNMMRAKIAAYIGGQRYARALLTNKSLDADARLYGQAIITHLFGSPRRAIPQISKLLKRQPKNPYVHEMMGEILLRSGKAIEAARAFKKAHKFDRYKAGYIQVELGHALLESGNAKATNEAITQLKQGVAKDPTAVAGYQYLAIAYGRQNKTALALLASAEFAVRTGKKGQAKSFAKRAQQSFKRGTPGWLRAEDIITFK